LDEAPDALLGLAEWELATALRNNATALEADYSIERAQAEWTGENWADPAGPDWRIPALGWIHATKFPPHLIDSLFEAGLAIRAQRDMKWLDPGDVEDWIGLHPALAGAYMKALAAQLGRNNYFEQLTDQSDLRVAAPSSDVQSALSLLLGSHAIADDTSRRDLEGVQTYLMLAMQTVTPANLEGIPAETIVNCRHDLAEEFNAFRDYVARQQTELTGLAAVPSERRRLEEYTSHVQDTIEEPLQRLERALHLKNLATTRSMVLGGLVIPPGVVALNAVGASPDVFAAGATIAAVGGAWWQIEAERQAVKQASDVSFLLDIRNELAPKSILSNVRRLLTGSYGKRLPGTRSVGRATA
jgi:hypothetical protein